MVVGLEGASLSGGVGVALRTQGQSLGTGAGAGACEGEGRLGVILDPLVRGTELGLEILGPWAFSSLELSFLV